MGLQGGEQSPFIASDHPTMLGDQEITADLRGAYYGDHPPVLAGGMLAAVLVPAVSFEMVSDIFLAIRDPWKRSDQSA